MECSLLESSCQVRQLVSFSDEQNSSVCSNRFGCSLRISSLKKEERERDWYWNPTLFNLQQMRGRQNEIGSYQRFDIKYKASFKRVCTIWMCSWILLKLLLGTSCQYLRRGATFLKVWSARKESAPKLGIPTWESQNGFLSFSTWQHIKMAAQRIGKWILILKTSHSV